MLEKFLTVPAVEFQTLLRASPPLSQAKNDGRREAYRYAKVGSCHLHWKSLTSLGSSANTSCDPS